MNVVFRVDASVQIGTGHVMRCLAVAEALRETGARCHFVSRRHDGHLLDTIQRRGFETHALPEPEASVAPTPQDPPHAAWLGVPWATDAAEFEAAMAAQGRADWVVVDHYALDARWESAAAAQGARVAVIDDLADRAHHADLLLDQTFGRDPDVYRPWVGPSCVLLCGSDYALLRPEFAHWRPASLTRREAGTAVRQVIVALGGVDKDDATSRVLHTLASAELAPGTTIRVVLGPSAPWLARVRDAARAMPVPCEVRVGIDNMAELLCASDLAVGAAGTSAWERCALGVPTLMLVLAENQREIARQLDTAGAAIAIDAGARMPTDLKAAWARLAHEEGLLGQLSARAAEVVSGGGTQRFADALRAGAQAAGHALRRLRVDDLDTVRRWRNHPEIRRHMHTRHEISAQEHRAWFERASQDPDRHLLVLVDVRGVPRGFVHFSLDAQRAATWGFYAAPDAPSGTGRHLGDLALRHAFETAGAGKILAEVVAGNDRSRRFHERHGFTPDLSNTTRQGDADSQGLAHYVLTRDAWLATRDADT